MTDTLVTGVVSFIFNTLGAHFSPDTIDDWGLVLEDLDDGARRPRHRGPPRE